MWPVIARAHGTHEERLEAATARIEEEEGEGIESAGAYLERANLYRRSGQWSEAWADLAQAAARNPTLPEVGLLRAMILMDSGAMRAAAPVLDSLLERHPYMGEARVLRSMTLEAEGRPLEAARELDRAVGDLACPGPDHYLRLARLLMAADPPEPVRALEALERGVVRLGPTPALVDQAVELELARGEPEAALRWHDRLRPFMEFDPVWLSRRGDLLVAAGQRWAALAAYTAALEGIEALPPARRATSATQGLEARLRSELNTSFLGSREDKR